MKRRFVAGILIIGAIITVVIVGLFLLNKQLYDSEGKQTGDWVQGTLAKSLDVTKTFVSVTLSYTRPPTESDYIVEDGAVYLANIYEGTCKEKGEILFLLPKIIKDNKGTGYGIYVEADLLKLSTPLSIKLYKSSNPFSNILVRYGLVKPVACADL
jgi:hypothetical protein